MRSFFLMFSKLINFCYPTHDGGLTTHIRDTEHKAPRDALVASEARFRELADAIPQIIYECEADGRVVFANRQWLDYAGQTDAQNADLGSVVHPDDLGALMRLWEASRTTGKLLQAEFRLRRAADGAYRWFLTRAIPVRDTAGQIVKWFGTSRDIHDQKCADQQLAESEARYRAIGEAIEFGVWVCDAEGRNTYASESFLRLVGITQQQCSDFGWGEVLHPDDAAETIAAWKECVRTQGTWDRVHRFKGVDGVWYSVLARGVPLRSASGEALGWAGINLDVTDRVNTEQAIVALAAESERQRRLYETVLTNTPDLAYVFDLNHRFTYANHALLTIWGKTWEESVGRTCLELGYEPWHATMHDEEIDRIVATKQPIRGEVAFEGTNGKRQYDYILVPVIGADGEVEAVAGTTRDVTERRQTEDQLRRNHDTFLALIHNNPFGVFAVDSDFRLREVSLGAQKVFETVRPLLERDFAEVLRILWPEPFASETISRFRHTLETGEPYSAPTTVERRADIDAVETYDWRIERISLPDGRYGVVCYFYDLSERQRLEATLLASEERLRLATNAANLGIWTWQPDEDVVVWENERPYEIFGLPRGEPPVTSARFKAEFLNPEDTAAFDSAFSSTIRLTVPLMCQCRIRRADGVARWIEFTGRVVEGEARLRLIGTVQDITDRKRIEEEQRRLADELQEAHRRKDEFLATLAHELRNPLAPIRTGLEVMRLAGTSGTIERTRMMMKRQLVQLIRLVDDLLDMSRMTSGMLELRLQSVDFKAVIDAAIETSHPAIEQSEHELAVILPDEPILLQGDAARLAQVVSNLLNNAAKYTHRGGHLRLTVHREEDTAVLLVADDGIGIPPPMLGKVFDMFTQVDRTLEKTSGGLGIGLSLVKGIVEMHGGTIEARSEGEGRGSQFVMRLPALSAARKIEPPAGGEPMRSSSRRRILVADDNVDLAESLGHLLEMQGNDVKVAHDGLEAVETAQSFRPDVVLLDIGMPKLNGHDACSQIRGQPWGKKAILIAMTGWGQDEDRRRSQEAGFDHHFVKPVDLRALEKRLAEAEAIGEAETETI